MAALFLLREKEATLSFFLYIGLITILEMVDLSQIYSKKRGFMGPELTCKLVYLYNIIYGMIHYLFDI